MPTLGGIQGVQDIVKRLASGKPANYAGPPGLFDQLGIMDDWYTGGILPPNPPPEPRGTPHGYIYPDPAVTIDYPHVSPPERMRRAQDTSTWGILQNYNLPNSNAGGPLDYGVDRHNRGADPYRPRYSSSDGAGSPEDYSYTPEGGIDMQALLDSILNPQQAPTTPQEEGSGSAMMDLFGFDDPEHQGQFSNLDDTLIDLGARMMAGDSPHFLQNVGQAILGTNNMLDTKEEKQFERDLAIAEYNQNEQQNRIATTLGIYELLKPDYGNPVRTTQGTFLPVTGADGSLDWQKLPFDVMYNDPMMEDPIMKMLDSVNQERAAIGEPPMSYYELLYSIYPELAPQPSQ